MNLNSFTMRRLKKVKNSNKRLVTTNICSKARGCKKIDPAHLRRKCPTMDPVPRSVSKASQASIRVNGTSRSRRFNSSRGISITSRSSGLLSSWRPRPRLLSIYLLIPDGVTPKSKRPPLCWMHWLEIKRPVTCWLVVLLRFTIRRDRTAIFTDPLFSGFMI